MDRPTETAPNGQYPPIGTFLRSPLVGFLDREAVAAHVLQILYPEGPRCPKCNAALSGRALEGWRRLAYVRCGECGRRFGWKKGWPALAGVHLDPAGVYLLSVALALGLTTSQAATLLGAPPSSVREWRARLTRGRSSVSDTVQDHDHDHGA